MALASLNHHCYCSFSHSHHIFPNTAEQLGCDVIYSIRYRANPQYFSFSPENQRIYAKVERLADVSPPNFFQLVLATEVFEHVAEPALGLANIYEVLQPGGYLIWSAPCSYRMHPLPEDHFRYTSRAATDLIEGAGFRIVERRSLGTRGLAFAEVLGMEAASLPPEWFELRAEGDMALATWIVARKPFHSVRLQNVHLRLLCLLPCFPLCCNVSLSMIQL